MPNNDSQCVKCEYFKWNNKNSYGCDYSPPECIDEEFAKAWNVIVSRLPEGHRLEINMWKLNSNGRAHMDEGIYVPIKMCKFYKAKSV